MKFQKFLAIILSLIMISSLMLFPVNAEETETQEEVPDTSVLNGCHTIEAQQPLLGTAQLVTNAKSVLMYETGSDTLLYAWNADTQFEPASFAKVMTAFIAIEKGNLKDAVTVKKSALSSLPASETEERFFENEVLTLEDLLYCMLVGSRNDAAAVIAEHIGGTQENFVQMMNDKAVELGCIGTYFSDPHGIDGENQYTTARDMCKILTAALEYETFETVFGATNYTVPATNKFSEARSLTTSNWLMHTDKTDYYDYRVMGGRTGRAKDYTYCLATSAESNGMHIISVVFGAASNYMENDLEVFSYGAFPETSALLDMGFTGYYTAQVLYEGQVLARRRVINGSSAVSLGCESAGAAVLPEGVSLHQLTVKFVDIPSEFSAPIKKGERLGGAEMWYGGLCIAYTNLYALNDVSLTEKIIVKDRYETITWWEILLIVVLVITVLVGVWFLLRNRRRIHNKIRMMQRKRRWKNRRGG